MIANNLVIFLRLGLVSLIIIRTLRRDIAKYNADDVADEAIEQSGWKLVHGDVFRPPKYPRLFVATIGSGVQIFLMSLVTICEYNIFLSLLIVYSNTLPFLCRSCFCFICSCWFPSTTFAFYEYTRVVEIYLSAAMLSASRTYFLTFFSLSVFFTVRLVN